MRKLSFFPLSYRKKRTGKFIDLFRVLIQKGVKIKIFTRPSNKQTGNFSQNLKEVIEQLRLIGAEVIECKEKMHQKVAIIDRLISWEGSLNILSHKDSEEQMRRLQFPATADKLIHLCELEKFLDGNNKNLNEELMTLEKCPKCGQEMVIKVSKYGAYLKCSDESCKGKRNIKKGEQIKTCKLYPNCNKTMVLRIGIKEPFLGCSGYPE